jgi:hypothetical protein
MTYVTTAPVALFLVTFVAWYAAHQVADHWLQTDHQAAAKGDASWSGRRACLGHVGTYTLAQAVTLYATAGWLGLHVSFPAALAGLAVSAGTHYFADRRTPLRKLAKWSPARRFFELKDHGLNGAYLLDQSWHIAWIFIGSLVVAGGW